MCAASSRTLLPARPLREIERLQWEEMDFRAGILRLADAKTGQKAILLNPPALEVLSKQERIGGSSFVFPATRGDGFFEGVPKVWRKVCDLAGLLDVRLHDLRHSFASVAVGGGASLPVIGALLGHTNAATTQRYARLSSDPLKVANEMAGSRIAIALMGGELPRQTG